MIKYLFDDFLKEKGLTEEFKNFYESNVSIKINEIMKRLDSSEMGLELLKLQNIINNFDSKYVELEFILKFDGITLFGYDLQLIENAIWGYCQLYAYKNNLPLSFDCRTIDRKGCRLQPICTSSYSYEEALKCTIVDELNFHKEELEKK